MRRINHSSRFIEITQSERTQLHALNKLTSIERKNVNPIRGTIYTLYSFPAYDNNRIPEVVDGGDIKSSKLLLTSNTVLYNKLNVRLRRVWNIKELKTNNNICSSEFIPLKVNKDVILQEYLMYCLTSDTVTEMMESASQGTSNSQQRISPSSLMQVSIPVIPKNEQKIFIELYQQSDKSKFSDFKSRFIEMFGNPLSAEQKYPLKRLADCVDINPRRPQLSLSDTDQVSFVPMPCVSEEGYLQDVERVDYGTVKKGFTYFEEGDVLFAKITPCMENGKGSIAEDLINGIGMGSTEYHVLREKPGISNKYWILAFTRLPIFREDAAKNMTGTGGQKRVGAPYLSDFRIGLPPIEAQQEFEQLYRQADKSKYLN